MLDTHVLNRGGGPVYRKEIPMERLTPFLVVLAVPFALSAYAQGKDAGKSAAGAIRRAMLLVRA